MLEKCVRLGQVKKTFCEIVHSKDVGPPEKKKKKRGRGFAKFTMEKV